MRDFTAELIVHYERSLRLYAEMDAEVREFVEEHPDNEDARGQLAFLADRHDFMQDELDHWIAVWRMAECVRRLPGVPGVAAKEESNGEN